MSSLESIGTFSIDVIPNTSGFQSSLKRSLDSAGKSLQKVGAGLTATVTAPLLAFGKAAVDSAEALSTAQAITAQVIKQTGGAAKVTAKDVSKLTKELERQTGVDDKLIQAGSNILLTFKGIRNEQGRNNDIFNRANGIMLDLATVTGTDATSAATQLGKALNDPVKGVTALQRVGVSFNEQQKEQIATLVDSGNTLDAQKLILAELESQYGGTAAASANATDKIAQSWENVKETLGRALLPVVELLQERFQGLAGRLEKLPDEQIRGIVKSLAAAAAVGPGLAAVGTFLRALSGIGVLLTPTGAVLTGLGLLVGAFGAVVARNDELRDELAGFVDSVRAGIAEGDWSAVGQAITDGFAKAVAAVRGAGPGLVGRVLEKLTGDVDFAWGMSLHIERGDWSAVGRTISSGALRALDEIDFGALGTRLGDGIVAAVRGVATIAGKIAGAIGDVVVGIDWRGVAERAAPAVLDFVFGLAGALTDPVVWFQAIRRNWDVVLPTVIGFMFAPARLLRPITQALRRIPLGGRLAAWVVESLNRAGHGILRGVASFFRTFGAAFRTALGRTGPGLITRFVRWVQSIPTAIGVAALQFGEAARRLVTRFADTLGRVGGTLARGAVDLIRRAVISAARTAGTWLSAGGRALLNGFREAILRAWNSRLAGWFRDLGGLIARIVGDLSRRLLSAGRQLISGLRSGISNGMEGIRDWLKRNVFDRIVGGIKSLFGIKSPSRVMAGLGRNMIQGLLRGLTAGNWDRIVRKVFGGVSSAAVEALQFLLNRGDISFDAVMGLPAKVLAQLTGLADGVGGALSRAFGKGRLVALGKWLQTLGARVSEHPLFGGVNAVHTPGSYHYRGDAIDVNFGPGGQNATEMAFFDRIVPMIRRGLFGSFKEILWRVLGHFNHLHVGGSFAKGGPVPQRAGDHKVPILARYGEHVWTDREVKAAGGHGAMLRLRQAVLSGLLQRFQFGGPVVNLRRNPGRFARGQGGVNPQWVAAVNKILERLKRGRAVFEDFTFRGMGPNVRRFHDAIAARFYRTHPRFDFEGTVRARRVIQAALRSWLVRVGEIQAFRPPKGYRHALGTLISRLRTGQPVSEDFSFRGMGRPVKRYRAAIAARFYRGHPGFDFEGTRAARRAILRSLQSFFDKIPKLQAGTPFVPRTGLYELHRGEAVLSKRVNRALSRSGGVGPIVVPVYINDRLLEEIHVDPERYVANKTAGYVRRRGGDVQAVLGKRR